MLLVVLVSMSTNSFSKDFSRLTHEEFFKLNKKQLIEASGQGYASAQLILGYYYGQVWKPANLNKALELFVKSANQGNQTAAFWAANYYWQGKGSAPNYQTACVYAAMNEGVQGNDAIPERLMATCYSNGWGVQHDLTKAEKLIVGLIKSGVDVHHMLAGVYKQQGKYLEAIAEYKQSSDYERGIWNETIIKLKSLADKKAREEQIEIARVEREKRVALKQAEDKKREEEKKKNNLKEDKLRKEALSYKQEFHYVISIKVDKECPQYSEKVYNFMYNQVESIRAASIGSMLNTSSVIERFEHIVAGYKKYKKSLTDRGCL